MYPEGRTAQNELPVFSGTIGLHFSTLYPHLVRSITLLDPVGLDLSLPQLNFPASLLASSSDNAHFIFPLLTSSLPIVSRINHYLWKSVLGHSFSHSDSLAFSFLARYSGGKHSMLRIGERRAKAQELRISSSEVQEAAVQSIKQLVSGTTEQSGISVQHILTEVSIPIRGSADCGESNSITNSTPTPAATHRNSFYVPFSTTRAISTLFRIQVSWFRLINRLSSWLLY